MSGPVQFGSTAVDPTSGRLIGTLMLLARAETGIAEITIADTAKASVVTFVLNLETLRELAKSLNAAADLIGGAR